MDEIEVEARRLVALERAVQRERARLSVREEAARLWAFLAVVAVAALVAWLVLG